MVVGSAASSNSNLLASRLAFSAPDANASLSASARVLDKILQKEVALEPIKATVDPEACSGCRICNGMCPFNAISFLEDRMLTQINPALCQGCGTCVAACPAGAISGTGFSDEQIIAQIDGLLLRTLELVGE